MTTRSNGKGKGKAQSNVQLDQFAFTVKNYAIEFGWPERKKSTRIIAHGNPSSKLFRNIIADTEQEKQEDMMRPTFAFTLEELAKEPNGNQTKVLLVSVALRAELPTGETHSKARLGIIGTSRPADDRVFALPSRYTGHSVPGEFETMGTVDDEEEASNTDFLLVVSPCYGQIPKGKQTKLCILVRPKAGLCSMFSIPGADVLYFSEFRDATKANTNRQHDWNALVMAQAVQNGNGSMSENPTSENSDIVMYGNPHDSSVAAVDSRDESVASINSCGESVATVDPTVAFFREVHLLARILRTKKGVRSSRISRI
jgi:hypothetical protein